MFIVEVDGSGMIPVQLLARKLDGGVSWCILSVHAYNFLVLEYWF